MTLQALIDIYNHIEKYAMTLQALIDIYNDRKISHDSPSTHRYIQS